MACTTTITEQGTRDVFYSIGVDQTENLKERIADLHGVDSEPMKAVDQLESYVSDPGTKKSAWYWGFYKRVRFAMWCLYPHAGDSVRTQMAREFIDDLFNGGYIRVLQSLAGENGNRQASFAKERAKDYSVPMGAVLLFGPRGGATMELLHFLAAERVHGMHRPGTSPNPHWSEKTKKTWYSANRTTNWPTVKDNEGEQVALDMPQEQGRLPQGVSIAIRKMWRCNPALRDYTGTNRLSGDIPYQIVEDVLDMLVQKKFSPLDEIEKARYNRIVERANTQGIDPFYAVYQNLFANKNKLRPLWNKARKLLYDYSILLWETQNELWLVEGKRAPASGVVYRSRKATVTESKKKSVPGTIYLNNGGYYWVIARKMKPQPLIDPKSKPKVPGSFIVNNGRYYWWIPGWVKHQRLVPKGEKFSTKDKTIALKIAKKLWAQIKKNDPTLAANIEMHTRINGTATKVRSVAVRVAAKMWRQIQKEDPELAAKILQDNRPKAKDHWYAQIVAGRKHRFVGSFETQAQAEAAYATEFEKTWSYPPGYNVQCIPKIDKVWPTWAEEKAHLTLMNERPRMPVIGQSDQTKPLVFMIERMQRVNWLVKNLILVLDTNSPAASADIAIQSRGKRWYGEIKKQGKRPVIRGSVSLDRDTGRIGIRLYKQGFSDNRVLAEEIYHIGFKIIRHSKPKIFTAIQRWYRIQLQKGTDPTLSMPDMFSRRMAMEESGIRSGLPLHVVKSARKIFSPANGVSDSGMHQVKACWSMI
ncbi:MAG: hypothetical protein CEE38_13760 [Planctomycetes bacterium B3_Pla]|nr:MAG: hypothetical protein CEE38_13760 [Planctomycetes bacterium B3_Pla]